MLLQEHECCTDDAEQQALSQAQWQQRYKQRHCRIRTALARFQATFGAGTVNAQPSPRGMFCLWGEPPQLRIQIQTWLALLDTLHAESASLEDMRRYIARPGCPAGWVLAQHHLRRRLALRAGAEAAGMDVHAFRDLSAHTAASAPQARASFGCTLHGVPCLLWPVAHGLPWACNKVC